MFYYQVEMIPLNVLVDQPTPRVEPGPSSLPDVARQRPQSQCWVLDSLWNSLLLAMVSNKFAKNSQDDQPAERSELRSGVLEPDFAVYVLSCVKIFIISTWKSNMSRFIVISMTRQRLHMKIIYDSESERTHSPSHCIEKIRVATRECLIENAERGKTSVPSSPELVGRRSHWDVGDISPLCGRGNRALVQIQRTLGHSRGA